MLIPCKLEVGLEVTEREKKEKQRRNKERTIRLNPGLVSGAKFWDKEN